MGPVHIGGRVPGTGVAADLGADQPVHGEQGELGERGDGPASAVRGNVVGDPFGPMGLTDPFQREPGDPGPSASRWPAEQRPADPAAEVLLLGPSPDRRGPCAHPAPSRHRVRLCGPLRATAQAL
ncbi:hypothetical protein Smic_32310 [Streptomyces microflavus]|uniref:Uncharacterized protein n=1 Tax=Streptomyces microflavus TaxID=1919 RepID=A0A7J0CSL0_STRMI|nr:hypothetical protein Smic_32310 [Streptomyces microflavus]